MSMRVIVVAAGPSFKSGVMIPAFENVCVYGVRAAVLGVKPSPNDGDAAIVRSVLKQKGDDLGSAR